MALTLKSEIAVSVDATKLYVTDKTGVYDVTTNPGGWGAPNENLYESCLVCLVISKASEGDELFEPISPSAHYIYDDTALNTDVKTFEIKHKIDSVLDVVLARLPVSLDEVNYVGGGTIQVGDYYYYDGDIYKSVGGTPTLLEDFLELATASNVLKDVCSSVLYPLLVIKAQSIYKQYRLERDKKCDDAIELKKQFQNLTGDLMGLSYAFYSSLKVQAQEILEDLLDEYEITENE